MLKSTHRPAAPTTTSLPAGWTEHKAPTGHTYYYNTSTKQSTYIRPSEVPAVTAPTTTFNSPSDSVINPSLSFLQYQSVSNIPRDVGPILDSFTPQAQFSNGRAIQDFQGGERSGHDQQRDKRPQPVDKPKSKHQIPGYEQWFLVNTKLGRRFVYNTEKGQSYWRIPEKLKDGILALDQQRIKEKAEALSVTQNAVEQEQDPGASEMPSKQTNPQEVIHDAPGIADDSSEYEEVEVTDDEDEENAQKRQRIEETQVDQAVEFNEDDIAFQLAAMGQEYGLEPDEYDHGNNEEWDEGVEANDLSHDDSLALFKDLLNDSGLSPYSSWDKIVEDGKLVDDIRYTALNNMKSRKEAWEDWSRQRIKHLREQRAKEEKKDPRIPYMAFLQKHASPKLYWPEFKRRFKKEQDMRDSSLSDKDREKWYREYINRLKLPQSTLKTDLLNLLKNQPLSVFNNTTLLSHLPPAILADVKYISIEPETRDPLIEAFITTLSPPPSNAPDADNEEVVKERQERERRQNALEIRERHVAEEKRRQRRNLELGKDRLREEEADIARAMNVTKKGLKDHLMDEGSGPQ